MRIRARIIWRVAQSLVILAGLASVIVVVGSTEAAVRTMFLVIALTCFGLILLAYIFATIGRYRRRNVSMASEPPEH